jgi:hypothetical protein
MSPRTSIRDTDSEVGVVRVRLVASSAEALDDARYRMQAAGLVDPASWRVRSRRGSFVAYGRLLPASADLERLESGT